MRYIILLFLLTSCNRWTIEGEPKGEDCISCRASWVKYQEEQGIKSEQDKERLSKEKW